MKNIIEAFRKEARLPYVIGILQITFLCLYFLSDTLDVYTESVMARLDGAFWWIAFFVLCVSTVALIIVPIVLIVKAYRFDRALSKKKRDEREISNEYIIANAGYKVAIFGLLVIVFLGADTNMFIDPYEVVLLVLLLMILGVRMYKRIQFEREV